MHVGFLTPEYVTPSSLDGGLANYLRKIGLALSSRGHRVSVLMLSGRSASWQDGPIMVREVKRPGAPAWLSRIPRLGQLVSFLTSLRSARRLAAAVWRIHRETPFDILQSSSYTAPGYALLRNGRIPLVCRLSSYTPLVRSAYGRQRTLSEYCLDWLEVRQVLDADAAFAPSQFMANIFANVEGFCPQVIHTPIDLDEPDDSNPSFYHQHLAGQTYLLFFGTLSRIKGVDLLADALPSVFEQHKNLLMVFIGRDDGLPSGQKVFDFICSRCQSFESRLQYHPALSKALLRPVIANAFGVVMPSRVDNYPNACLEAQSLGIPVIGTDNSSLEEMVMDGETGFLATNGCPVSLENAIERLLSQTPEERQRMQERIRAQVRDIAREDRIGKLIDFYQAVIQRFRLDHGYSKDM